MTAPRNNGAHAPRWAGWYTPLPELSSATVSRWSALATIEDVASRAAIEHLWGDLKQS